MSGCEKITPLLSEYVDGRLAAGQRQQVEEHLATCAACRPSLLFVYLRAATAAVAVMFVLLMGGGFLVQEAVAPFAATPAALQVQAPEGAAPSIAGTPAPAPQP